MEEKKDFLVDGQLPNKKVMVLPIQENPGWVKDPKHVAFFKLENTFDRLVLPTQKRGMFKNAVTKEEKELIEGLLGDEIDLSIYKKQGKPSFWASFVVKLDKYGKQLDLSEPLDYLSFKVLLMNESIVAPSYETRLTKSTYRYYISDGEAEATEKKNKIGIKTKAFAAYGKMASDKSKLAAFLKVYNLVTKNTAINIDPNSTLDFLSDQVVIIVDDNPKEFLEFVTDPLYDVRLLLAEGLSKGAVKRDSNGYSTSDGVLLGKTVSAACSFLNLDANQDVLFGIQAKVKSK